MALSEKLKKALFVSAYLRAKAGKPSLVKPSPSASPSTPQLPNEFINQLPHCTEKEASELSKKQLDSSEAQRKAVRDGLKRNADAARARLKKQYCTAEFTSALDPVTANGRSILADGRLLTLLDAAKAAGIDLSAMRAAAANKSGADMVAAIDAVLLELKPKPQRTTGTNNAVTDAERD